MAEVIEPIILAKGEALLAEHRAAGDKLVIITATKRFVTAPIAERLGVETLIATECGMQDGRYTGQITGTPCYQAGKVTRLNEWLAEAGYNLDGAYFYSDSRNDLPLLEAVASPGSSRPGRGAARHRHRTRLAGDFAALSVTTERRVRRAHRKFHRQPPVRTAWAAPRHPTGQFHRATSPLPPFGHPLPEGEGHPKPLCGCFRWVWRPSTP